MSREKKFSAIVDEVEDKAESIALMLGDFKEGPRGLFLMNRTKDGGGNTEEKRLLRFELYTDEEKFMRVLKEYLVLKAVFHPVARIYISVNRRDILKSVRFLEEQLLDAHYTPVENKIDLYTKYLKSMRTVVMQPQSRSTKMFLIDCDDDETIHDKNGQALDALGELGVRVILNKRTKNGWHIVTEPFDLGKWNNSLGEIKKDALLCIDL